MQPLGNCVVEAFQLALHLDPLGREPDAVGGLVAALLVHFGPIGRDEGRDGVGPHQAVRQQVLLKPKVERRQPKGRQACRGVTRDMHPLVHKPEADHSQTGQHNGCDGACPGDQVSDPRPQTARLQQRFQLLAGSEQAGGRGDADHERKGIGPADPARQTDAAGSAARLTGSR